MADPLTPASVLLVHGAGSGPWVYDDWPEKFSNVRVSAIDLQDGLELCRASMAEYAGRVAAAAAELPAPVALCGWSLGGLAVLQAAERVGPHTLILIEPSAPGEIQGFDPALALTEGTFDPEAVYGRFPPGVRARPESSLARSERKRGISVPSLPCPSLVVYGDEFRQERGLEVARLYGSEEIYMAGLSHWDLVLDPRVPEAIAAFLGVSTHGTAVNAG